MKPPGSNDHLGIGLLLFGCFILVVGAAMTLNYWGMGPAESLVRGNDRIVGTITGVGLMICSLLLVGLSVRLLSRSK